MDGERDRFADFAFWRGVGLFAILLTWRLISRQEIVLEERNFGPRARSIFFVNVVRAPHPRGGVRIRRMVGYQ